MMSNEDSVKRIMSVWPFLIALATIAALWGALGAKVSALEERVLRYPSEEYFDERFQNIEEDIQEIKESLK